MGDSTPVADLPSAAPVAAQACPILIHVGLHKTGTTWLQECVFANEAFGFATPWGEISSLAIEEFVNRDPMSFDADEVRAKFAAGRADAQARGLIPVISHEALSARPMSAQYYGAHVAEKLAAVFPDARIIIGIREQKKMLLSLFGQFIRIGGRETLTEFIGTGHEPVGWAPVVSLDFLRYDRFVAYYRRLFGNENVLVLPLELLSRDRAAYLDKLARFAGVPPIEGAGLDSASNAGWGGVTLAVHRRMNSIMKRNRLGPNEAWHVRQFMRFCYKFDRYIPKCLNRRIEERWKAKIKLRVGDTFKESNSALGAMIDEDLGALGYPVLDRKD